MFDRLFDCVICQRPVVDYDGRNGRDRHLAPTCRGCERHYSDRAPEAGAFMDRRKAAQISALANALGGAAHCMEWESKHART